MAQNDAERGVRQGQIRRRVGMGIDRFKGENLQRDPGSIQAGQFQRLINVEHDGSIVVSRDGLATFNGTAIGPVRSAFGSGDEANPVRLYVFGFVGSNKGLLVVDADADAKFSLYSLPSQDSTAAYYFTQAGGKSGAATVHAGDMYVALAAYPVANAGGAGAITLGASLAAAGLGFFGPPVEAGGALFPNLPAIVAVDRLPAVIDADDVIAVNGEHAVAVAVAEGQPNELFVAAMWVTESAPGVFQGRVGYLYRWDGAVLTQVDTTSSAPGGSYDGGVVMGVNRLHEVWWWTDGQKQIRMYDSNLGVASAPALPAGVGAGPVVTEFCDFPEAKLFYIAAHDGGALKILSWDGATMVTAHSITVRTAYQSALCYFQEAKKLYYAHRDNATGFVYIGTFDGTTWSDTAIDFHTLFASDQVTAIDKLVVYRGELYAFVESAISPTYLVYKITSANAVTKVYSASSGAFVVTGPWVVG